MYSPCPVELIEVEIQKENPVSPTSTRTAILQESCVIDFTHKLEELHKEFVSRVSHTARIKLISLWLSIISSAMSTMTTTAIIIMFVLYGPSVWALTNVLPIVVTASLFLLFSVMTKAQAKKEVVLYEELIVDIEDCIAETQVEQFVLLRYERKGDIFHIECKLKGYDEHFLSIVVDYTCITAGVTRLYK